MSTIFGARKEDDIYYQGAFWIVGDSVKSIKHGAFEIVGVQLPCDFDGNYLEDVGSKNSLSHKNLWNREIKRDVNPDVSFDYYPRGRVAIYKGNAWIHLHSVFNQPNIIDTIIDMYNLHKLEYEIDLNDTYQGGHYDFKLD